MTHNLTESKIGYDYTVLIIILTYNHEFYIEEALNSILMQQVSFPFLALVIDDCSQDQTTSIVRRYEQLYPDHIKGIYRDANRFSKGSLGSLLNDELISSWMNRSKYIAACEGDDYWIKPDKLQKQVEFMENHPDYSMCFHNAMVRWQDGSVQDEIFSDIETREYKPIEIFEKWIVPTASIIVRSDVFSSARDSIFSDRYKWIYLDMVVFLHCAVRGRVYGMSEVMSVYRRTQDGLTHKLGKDCSYNVKTNEELSNHFLYMIDLFGDKMGFRFKYICLYNYALYNKNSAFLVLKRHDLKLFISYFFKSLQKTLLFTIYHYSPIFKWAVCKLLLKYVKVDVMKFKQRITGRL